LNRSALLQSLQVYHTTFDDERVFVPLFKSLLIHPRAYFRDHLPGHMTGSSWVIDKSRQYVLLTHHVKLNRWLQPGGHADGDEDIFGVAIREAKEETGLQNFSILRPDIFDIDIHKIPSRTDFPAHFHYDVRVLLQAEKDIALSISNESHALEWVHVGEVGARTDNNASIMRMVEKVKRLFAAQQ
jgi:8-oxo-dGTP pyrophosphatase MutT (NUDIX family)